MMDTVWVHLAVLRIEKERLFPRYIELALNSPHCYAQSQEYARGISNFDLGLTRMIKITVPLPPLADLAAAENVDRSNLGKILRLTLLAPDIVEAILDGTEPGDLQIERLLKPFPVEWEEQRRFLATDAR